MIYITFSLLILSVVGIALLFVFKNKTRLNSYLLARVCIAIFGLAILLLGFCFRLESWPYASFLSTLFYMLGAQICLWSIGISSEVIGNAPQSEKSVSSLSGSIFGSIIYAAACFAFVALGFLSRNAIEKYINGGGTRPQEYSGFMSQVSTETHLAERPNWKTVTVKAKDDSGKEIEIVLGVLWDSYRWVKGDTNYVTVDKEEKKKVPIENIIENFRDDEKRPIIAVGTASHENAEENPQEEIRRAQARANKLAEICESYFVNKPHIYTLNLGAFKSIKKHSLLSSAERRVILLVINKGEDSKYLTLGVAKALVQAKEENNFIIDVRDYSLYGTDRFKVERWIKP